jgi:hypothetical protein
MPSDGKMQRQLLHPDTDKAPPYVAISYTFGNREVSCHIDLNDQRLGISKNLEESLIYLGNFQTDMCFWADSICVNRKNLKEKRSQIHLTKSIY